MSSSDVQLLTQLMWLGIFVIGTLSVGSCLTFILLFNKKRIGIYNNLFLACMGYSVVPFMLGLYMLLMSFIPLKLPYYLYVFIPYTVSIVFLAINKDKIFSVIKNIKIDYGYVEKEYILFGIIMALMLSASCILEQISYLFENKVLFYFIFMAACLLLFRGITARILKCKKDSFFYMGILALGFICIYLEEIFNFEKIDALLPFNVIYLILVLKLIIAIAIGTLLLSYNKNAKNIKVKVFLCFFPIFILYLSGRYFAFVWINSALLRLFGDFLFGVLCALLYLYIHNGQMIKKMFTFVKCATIIYFFVMILRGGVRPVWGSDATEYLSNALKFIETMSFSGINNFNGISDGSLLAIIHHPGWVLYLAFGLLHTSGKFGFPNDYAARFSIQLCLICLFIASIGIISLFKKKHKTLSAGLIMPMAYWGLVEVYQQHTRDAYRIIPLLLLIGIISFIMQEKNKKNELKTGIYILSFFICMFIMMGHPINAISSVIIVAAFMIWMLLNRKFYKEILLWGISCAAGAAAGAYQIIWAFFSTGKMTGGKIDIDKLLLNSDYYENYMNYSQSRLKGAENYYERLKLILAQDKGVLLILAVCLAVIILAYLIKKKDYGNKLVFLCIIVIIQSFMFTDIISWSGGSLSEWCVMNWRYTLQIYVIYGLFLGIALEEIFEQENIYTFVRMGIICFLCIPMYILVSRGISELNQTAYNRISEYAQINDSIEKTGGRILLDNYYCNYYLYDKGLSMFTDNAESIRMAASLDELDCELRNSNCTGILIMDSLRSVYWNDSLLEEYTESDKYIKEVIDTSFCTAYILK